MVRSLLISPLLTTIATWHLESSAIASKGCSTCYPQAQLTEKVEEEALASELLYMINFDTLHRLEQEFCMRGNSRISHCPCSSCTNQALQAFSNRKSTDQTSFFTSLGKVELL